MVARGTARRPTLTARPLENWGFCRGGVYNAKQADGLRATAVASARRPALVSLDEIYRAWTEPYSARLAPSSARASVVRDRDRREPSARRTVLVGGGVVQLIDAAVALAAALGADPCVVSRRCRQHEVRSRVAVAASVHRLVLRDGVDRQGDGVAGVRVDRAGHGHLHVAVVRWPKSRGADLHARAIGRAVDRLPAELDVQDNGRRCRQRAVEPGRARAVECPARHAAGWIRVADEQLSPRADVEADGSVEDV